MAGEQRLIPMEGFVLKRTNDLVIMDLVDAVDPAFQQTENKEDRYDEPAGDAGDQQITGADARAQGCRHPDHGGGGDAVDLPKAVSFKNDACADKADARDDVGGDTIPITRITDELGEDGEKSADSEVDPGI